MNLRYLLIIFLTLSVFTSWSQNYQKQIDSLQQLKIDQVANENFVEAQTTKLLLQKYIKLDEAIKNEDFVLAKEIKDSINKNVELNQSSQNDATSSKIIIYGHSFLEGFTQVDPRQAALLRPQSYQISVNNSNSRTIHARDTLVFSTTVSSVKIRISSGTQTFTIDKEIVLGENHYLIANIINRGSFYLPKPYLQEIDESSFCKEFNYEPLISNPLKSENLVETIFYMDKFKTLDTQRTIFLNGKQIIKKAKKKNFFKVLTRGGTKQNLQMKFNYSTSLDRYYLRFEEIQFVPGKKYLLDVIIVNAFSVCKITEIVEPINLKKFTLVTE